MIPVIQQFEQYKTHLAVNYAPNFPSAVQRVIVFKEMARALLNIEKEIEVEYKDGRKEPHKFSEFEAVLQSVYDTYKEV